MTTNPKTVRNVLAKNILADGFEPILDLEKSHGSYLVDARNDDEYLDMFTMYASGSVGFNHPEIVKNKSILTKASLFKPTLSDIYTVEYADFMKVFSKFAIPNYLTNAFFIEGGSLAVENALKIAFDWKVRKNLSRGIKNKGSQVIHFNEAFHGRSGYTLSLTNTFDPRKTMYFPKFDWPRITNPKLTFPLNDNILNEVKRLEHQAVNEIKTAIKNNKNDISCIIMEPIQGEGGDNHFRTAFFKILRQLCDENEMLFILDEVQTGVGITGKMWAHEHYGIKPDIISFGKKAQVCGLLCGDRINEVEDNVFNESSRINSTFGGNLVDMLRFKIILEIIDREKLINNAQKLGDYLLEKIINFSEEFPAYITNPRGKGLFCAFDLPSSIERDLLITNLIKDKLLILPSGAVSIRFRPHLNVSKSDLDKSIEIIFNNIKKILK